MNSGLPSSLLSKLYAILIRCEQLNSRSTTKAMFVDKRISEWRGYLPDFWQ